MAVIEVICPCCDEILEIQTDSSRVLSHRPKKRRLELDEFMMLEQSRASNAVAKFEENQKNEGDRRAALNSKFEKNKQRGEGLPDPPRLQWD